MNTEHLRSAVVLSETGTYRKAGDRLFMEGLTVWRHVNKLEKELGFPLFEKRSGVARKHAITPQGRVFLARAKEALRLLDEGMRKQ